MKTLMMIAVATAALAGTAQADNPMKVCGARYQAAKAAKTLPAGQTWAQFLAGCRSTAATAPAAPSTPAAPAAAAAKPASHLPGAQSPAMAAMHDRQRQCGAQWQAAKAAGKVAAGQKWPQFWSACNTRLKG